MSPAPDAFVADETSGLLAAPQPAKAIKLTSARIAIMTPRTMLESSVK
jgi:hypothetical protein